MTISTPALTNFTAGEISPRLAGRVDISKYYNACREVENFIIHPHGGATRRSGLRYVADAINHSGFSWLIPFEFNAEQSYVLEFGENDEAQGIIRVFKDRGQVLSGDTPYTLESPYVREDFERLKYAQSNDTLILTHPKHPVRSLTRHDHDQWVLEDIEFIDPPQAWKEGNYPATVCFFEDRLVLACTTEKPNTVWLSRSGEYYDFRMNTREVPLSTWGDCLIKAPNDGLRDGKHGNTFLFLDGDSFEADCAVKGATTSGEKRYYRYKGSKVFLASGSDLKITFASVPKGNQIEAIHDSSGNLYTAFWDEYQIGDRIEALDGDSPLDDDAIEVTLSASHMNAIEFLVPKSRLWIGTLGGEWTLGGASSSEAITPSSAKANHEGTAGASKALPVSVGLGSLFVQRAGRKIRDMSYQYVSDAYASKDLTILAEHITAPSVIQLAYAQEPDSIVYCLRSDGVLLALTYQKDQDVLAWSRLTTQGKIENITTIFNHQESADELWVVVKRVVNGQERRFIEILEPPFAGDSISHGFFLDSGLSYSGEPVEELSGLDHLAGERISVLADGLVSRELEVSAEGKIVLEQAASLVHAGLTYSSLLKTMPIEGGSAKGTSQTKNKRIVEVSVRFFKTLGGKVGADNEHLEPVYFLTTKALLGQALKPWSGDKRVKFPKGWDKEGAVCIVQDLPLPMSVLLIVPEVVQNT